MHRPLDTLKTTTAFARPAASDAQMSPTMHVMSHIDPDTHFLEKTSLYLPPGVGLGS